MANRMPYLIDGHNLIPKIPGMSLSDLDDEMHLAQRLQVVYRQLRKPVEVYFDKAPAGRQGSRRYGMVRLHFVRQSLTADEAIRMRLHKLGREAPNWTVVSSDHQVQADAHAAHAHTISSEEFAALLLDLENRPQPSEAENPALTPQEVEEWLEEFHRAQGKGRNDL
jgi:predicted RNA-binding protein with PIN domain